ncbi:MAG: hypothetical protein JO171_20130 [Paludibacterium sp.]|uniref:hypothetical protein n=1 Tax=Paludibacterium sp. TaxID=1917523 RepID=UPI0025F0487D|nr:hypothetical protein [Paludibacterium sp.]MBV8049463.1 hypothetical protein [Paludibacterium sp.]MBV8646886.1 hypothetical protein [Paludibacterium sp.]
MATQDGKAVHVVSPTQRFRQEQLLSLISVLCNPREQRRNPDVCRLVVDSRLAWRAAPIDANTSWLYLPVAARAREVAGCLVLTAD